MKFQSDTDSQPTGCQENFRSLTTWSGFLGSYWVLFFVFIIPDPEISGRQSENNTLRLRVPSRMNGLATVYWVISGCFFCLEERQVRKIPDAAPSPWNRPTMPTVHK